MSTLLEEALEAHGGVPLFRRVRTLRVLAEIGGAGLIMRLYFQPIGKRWLEISTQEPRVTAFGWPREGLNGCFDKGDVRLETPEGRVVKQRLGARRYFRRPPHLWDWDTLDVMYFLGYAVWNYFNTPFFFSGDGIQIEEIEPWTRCETRLRRLRVRFPSDFHTHSAEQVFYFNSRGFVTRFDYTLDVVGGWARVHQFVRRYQQVDGLWFPFRRRAFLARDIFCRGLRRQLNLATLIWGDIEKVELVE